MAEQFGKTWWGEQWLQSLNNIDYSNRLPRGASYARKGAVKQINIEGNRISAKVSGSRPSPYKVDIILPPFFEPELGMFIDQIASQPLLVSKLLNRELDPSLLNLAVDQGLKVFPQQWSDFKMQCSCPDWAVPCKHLASVIYKLSSEIDNNPFLVFELHLVNLIAELDKRGLNFKTEVVEIPALIDFYFEKDKSKKSQTKKAFEIDNAYQKLSFNSLSNIYEPIFSLLADKPVFYTGFGDFKSKYETILKRIVRNGQRLLKGKIDFETVLQQAAQTQFKINTHSTNNVSIDDTFHALVRINDDRFSLPDFILELSHVPVNKTRDFQPSTAALHTLLQLSIHLVANGAIVPQIVQNPHKQFAIRWLPAMLSKDVRALVEKLETILPPEIFWWRTLKSDKKIDKQISINLLSVFISELVMLLSGKDTDDLFLQLFFFQKTVSFNGPGEASLPGGIHTWLQKYYLTQRDIIPQVVVSEESDEHFLVTLNIGGLNGDPDSFIPFKEILTLDQYSNQRLDVLQAITILLEFIPGLETFINTNGKESILLDLQTFTPFIFQMIPIIRLLDIEILLPKSLQEILKPKPSVRVKVKPGKSFLRLDQLLDFEWQIAVGDTLMNEAEFEKLLQKSDGLLKYKSQYIYVNKEELKKIHKHFSSHKELNTFDILRSVLSSEYHGSPIALDDNVKTLIQKLTEVKDISIPKNLHAQLRPYQQRGFSWMYRNAKIGFGSVIADDMGLGKTLQVITTLLKFKEEGLLDDKKALVIAPTGLLANWQAEIEKFAPSIRTILFHGNNRKITDKYDVLLTSYGIARTESAVLKKMLWQSVVIDEAQNIKNQDTAQAKAIKSIKADNYIAMSGTPVENRLSELWSLHDYSNQGLLGSNKEFKENFGDPIETFNDHSIAEKLKKVTGPFMMRRLKTDKSIISDLPDKIEMNAYGSLSAEQASLYTKTLDEAMMTIDAIDAQNSKQLFVRQGLVLQMILALKQICNHPTQYLKNNRLEASLSGKMSLLFEKLDTIRDSGEKVLIFTQFKEMGNLLQHFIYERYQESPLFYHGGCSVKQRKEMVESFQSNPADKIFILSLKAAGTGLNLTAANHVIHYDLWWNPAVEAQATDRAYRIGQKNNVMVHRFITKNTFEERINEMIQSKKALADMTVSAGENWIGNLSNKELKDLFIMR